MGLHVYSNKVFQIEYYVLSNTNEMNGVLGQLCAHIV